MLLAEYWGWGMSKRKEVLQRPAGDSRPANQTFMDMLASNKKEMEARLALVKENITLKARIAELEALLHRARATTTDAALGRDIDKLLRKKS